MVTVYLVGGGIARHKATRGERRGGVLSFVPQLATHLGENGNDERVRSHGYYGSPLLLGPPSHIIIIISFPMAQKASAKSTTN